MRRRTFLNRLVSLPIIGGSVTLLGNPTSSAVPITTDLLHSYNSWLFYERRMLCHELARYDTPLAKEIEAARGGTDPLIPGDNWHFQWAEQGGRGPAGWMDAPQPSTRAAVVLSSAGVPLCGDG